VWLYLAVILNLPVRRVIGRAVSNRMKRDPLALRRCMHRQKAGDLDAEDGHRTAVTVQGLHLPQRPRQPIEFARLPEGSTRPWPEGVNERRGQLLR
jgi:hypothetical protein